MQGLKENQIKSVADLKIYQLSYELAMEIFEITKKYPREEMRSLTDQIRRSSRSVAINIREGFAKRKYKQVFLRHLNDAFGSSEETRGWLQFSLDCRYLLESSCRSLDSRYDQLNAMIYKLMNTWKDY